jgi:hypothetical protein
LSDLAACGVVKFGGLESVREGEFDKGNLGRGIWEGEWREGKWREGNINRYGL